jgi:hypothetical protein
VELTVRSKTVGTPYLAERKINGAKEIRKGWSRGKGSAKARKKKGQS